MAHFAFSTNRPNPQTVLYNFMGHLGHDAVSEIQQNYGKYGKLVCCASVGHGRFPTSMQLHLLKCGGLEKSRLSFIDIQL
jgi:hypothetical protein